MKTKKPLISICFILLALYSITSVAKPVKNVLDEELVFGILPFLSPISLMKRFNPLREYMEVSTGATIVIESAPDFSKFLQRSVNNEYDIIYTAPHFVPANLKNDNYQLLAASKDIAASVIVSNTGKIETLAQLAGKRIAHGPEQAFLVIIGKYLLREQGLEGDNSPVFLPYKSHNAALQAVSGKEADAAIVGTFHLKKAAENKLKSIAKTQDYPGVAILASTNIPENIRSKLAQSLIKIKESDAGRATLKKIRFPGFQSATAQDYESLKPVARQAMK